MEVVVTSFDNDGAIQLTEIVELTTPPTLTVGWFGSLLHSRTFPIEFLANPLPVSFTGEPLAKPVVGVPVNVAAA